MSPEAQQTTVSDADAQSAHLRRAAGKVAWRLIPLLGAGYLISYIDRTNISFAALTMNEALGLSATQFGLAAGIFYVGYVALELPSTLALRRVGARRWLARIMITWGLAAAATGFVTGANSLYFLRLLTGAAEAGFYPGVIFYLCTWFPAQYRAQAFAWFTVANPFSSVLSAPLSTALLHVGAGTALAGWQWLFICEGLPAVLVGALILFLLPEQPNDVAWLTDEEKLALQSTLASEHRAGDTTNLWRAIRDPRVLVLTGSYFLLIVGVLGVTLWLPQMLKQRGLTTGQIGMWSAGPYLLACLGMVLWAAHIDRTRKYLGNYVVACLLAATGFALSVAVDSLPVILLGISVALIGMNASRPAFFAILPTFLRGAAAAGTIALINSVGNLGGFFGPYMMGWLRERTGSFQAGLFGLALALGAAGLSALLFTLIRSTGAVPPDQLRSRSPFGS